MNATCPICRRDTRSESIFIPLSGGSDLHALARKINPSWELRDGCCEDCLNQMGKMLGELRNGPEKGAAGYPKSFYRYHLNRRERGQWHHCNPDMQKWRQGQIQERVSEEAIAQGYVGWLIFDGDEVMIGQGVLNIEP